MINWILNLIGIVAYFIGRYSNRKNKTIKRSASFWLNDNWPELTQTLLLNIALMIILEMDAVEVKLDSFFSENIPYISIDPAVGKAIIALGLGLGLTALIYSAFRKKVK